MKINYSLNQDDYLSFNTYHAKNSESVKSNLKIQRFITPLLFFIFPFIAKNKTDIPFWYWIGIFSVVYIVWAVYYPKYYFNSIKKGVKKMLKEGKNQDLLGSKTVELRQNDILSSGENSESKVKWNTVERYVETNDHIFIYISAMEAYIVPKRSFNNDEEKTQFIEILNNKIK